MTANFCLRLTHEDDEDQMIQFIIHLFTSKYSLCNAFKPDLTDKSMVNIIDHNMGLPFVSESQFPDDAIDWTTKDHLENNRIIKWHTEGCSLYPINTYVDDGNEFGLVSKRTLNNVMRYLTKMVTIILEGVDSVEHQKFRSGWFHKWGPQSHEFLSQNPQGASLFVLAHLMQRPIIALSDSSQVAGIYIPFRSLHYICSKDPIVISYHLGQYCPLVGIIPKEHSSTSSYVTFPLTTSGNRFSPVRTFGLPSELKIKQLPTICDYLHLVVYQSNPTELNVSLAAVLSNDKHALPLGNGRLIRLVDNGFTLNINSLIDGNDNATLASQCERTMQYGRTCSEQLDERETLKLCIADSCEQEIGFTTFPFCEDCHKKLTQSGKNGKIHISNHINYVL